MYMYIHTIQSQFIQTTCTCMSYQSKNSFTHYYVIFNLTRVSSKCTHVSAKLILTETNLAGFEILIATFLAILKVLGKQQIKLRYLLILPYS